MNLNQRIETFRGDGIPGYNRKINEVITAVNWLLGVRVINGRPVRESDQGPVFDLSPVNMTQVQPAPTIQNFQNYVYVINDPGVGISPKIQTANPSDPPINPPIANPRFFVYTLKWYPYMAPGNPAQAPAPWLFIGNGLTSSDSPISFDWSFTINYEGTIVYSVSGSATAVYNQTNYILLDPTGWQYEPSGLQGYSKGTGRWVWKYNGLASANTNPTILETFTFSSAAPLGMEFWPIVFLAG